MKNRGAFVNSVCFCQFTKVGCHTLTSIAQEQIYLKALEVRFYKNETRMACLWAQWVWKKYMDSETCRGNWGETSPSCGANR